MHASPHRVVPAPQVHTPPKQRAPDSHIVPHPPQLFGSVLVSEQIGPHIVPAHVHVPIVHNSPTPHTPPHRPQFIRSVFVSTHTPAHRVPPPPHEHTPAEHVPPEQAFPQAPQFVGLV